MLILIVEDEALTALALEWALTAAGHTVLGPVDSAADALALAQHRTPDLALVDFTLSGPANGGELVHVLAAEHHTPCLFLTAQLTQASADRDSAWGIVRKPFDPAAILGIVEFMDRLLKGEQLAKVPTQLELWRVL